MKTSYRSYIKEFIQANLNNTITEDVKVNDNILRDAVANLLSIDKNDISSIKQTVVDVKRTKIKMKINVKALNLFRRIFTKAEVTVMAQINKPETHVALFGVVVTWTLNNDDGDRGGVSLDTGAIIDIKKNKLVSVIKKTDESTLKKFEFF